VAIVEIRDGNRIGVGRYSAVVFLSNRGSSCDRTERRSGRVWHNVQVDVFACGVRREHKEQGSFADLKKTPPVRNGTVEETDLSVRSLLTWRVEAPSYGSNIEMEQSAFREAITGRYEYIS
jgi:hypothetical protein